MNIQVGASHPTTERMDVGSIGSKVQGFKIPLKYYVGYGISKVMITIDLSCILDLTPDPISITQKFCQRSPYSQYAIGLDMTN